MATPVPIYTLKNARLRFGSKPLFTGVDIHITKGDKICLIGRNGSGKSTLLKIIAGQIEPDEGEIFIQPGTQVAFMPQESDFTGFQTLRDFILAGLPRAATDAGYKADILIQQFDIDAGQNPAKASGGERKKAALAQALISEPDILLLDEPTNHLDVATIEKLEDFLIRFTGALIIISHDKAFLKHVSTATIWLDRGIAHENDKGFDAFDAWQDALLEQEIIAQKHLAKKIDAETEWLHKGVTARRKRNMGRLRRLQQLRQERREQVKQTGHVKLEIDKGAIQSRLIVETKHVSKSFGDREIVHDFSIRILRGNKIGVVGPNGSGKSTLIKLLTKRLEPDSGHVRIAKNLEEAYFDQNRITLDPDKTLWKTLCPEGDHIFVRGHYRHVVSYLKDFLFTPEQAKSPVGVLSGGEKNRLMLALILSRPSNFLVLDEPTNDLDMDTLDLLQEVLDEYTGTILIVSHDRDFLDKVVPSLLYLKGDGTIVEHIGACSELLAAEKEKAETGQKRAFKTVKKTPVPLNTPTNKLSFTEQHILKLLPNKISKLEETVKALEERMADSELYQKDADLFHKTATELATVRTELEQAENQWLDLQLRLEENA